jgi:hypothetical protein
VVSEKTSSHRANASVASYGKMASLVTAETLEGAMVAKRYSDQFRQGLS